MKSETDFFVRFLCVGEFHQFHPLLFKQINIHTFVALGVMSVTTVWSQCENVKKKKDSKAEWGEVRIIRIRMKMKIDERMIGQLIILLKVGYYN